MTIEVNLMYICQFAILVSRSEDFHNIIKIIVIIATYVHHFCSEMLALFIPN